MGGSQTGLVASEAAQDEFRHEALFYSGEEELLERTGAFVRAGLEADEPVLVALSARKIEALRSRLREAADRVELADMGEIGGNPARIIPAWSAFVRRHSQGGRRLRGVGEPIWAERGPAELVECQRHESLLNLAFADTPGFYLLCPYDTDALGSDVLEEARRSHPFLAADGVVQQSPDCRSLEEVAAPFAEPLPEPARRPDARVFHVASLAAVRDFVRGRALRAGLSESRTEELVLAAHEVAMHSVFRGREGIVRVWLEDEALVCEVDGTAPIEDPLAGRERPTAGRPEGGALWLANELCELVQVRSFPGGSAVRMHKRRG